MQGVDLPQPAGIVESAMNGDHEALRALWAQHRRWVAAVILAHKPASADVDDLLQDVAATLVAKIGTLTEPASFVPWLRTIAINAARLAGRRHVVAQGGLRIVRERVEHAGAVAAPEASEAPARRDEAARLMGLAMELHEDYREPLLLRAVHDLSYREISSILGLPETTIETRIARARRMLRERAAPVPQSPTPPAGRAALTEKAPSRIS